MPIVRELRESPYIVYGILGLKRDVLGVGLTPEKDIAVLFSDLCDVGLTNYQYHRITILHHANSLEDATLLAQKETEKHKPTLRLT